MPRKNVPPAASEKIAPTAFEISIAKSGFLKPYITCFSALPDNIAREPLGMLAGILSIRDRSESSAYIVNFLASLSKKEYYANHHRSAVESFEASLNKINLGLSELAKEGNTEWIGTLDAAVLAIERNNLHFSVAGDARVLLLRDQRLSVVSEGLTETGEPHPMKTFTDVASGKICSGDRILIATPEVFSILSEVQLERSASKFSEDEFERFLRTAIINQLDCAASILVSMRTVEEYRRPQAPQRIMASPGLVPNAWSLSTFENSKRSKTSVKDTLEEKRSQDQEKERIDSKTGHIYIAGEIPQETTSEKWERAQDILDTLRNTIKIAFRSLRFELSRLVESMRKITALSLERIAHIVASLKNRNAPDTRNESSEFNSSPYIANTQEFEPDSQRHQKHGTTKTMHLCGVLFFRITSRIRTFHRDILLRRASTHIPVREEFPSEGNRVQTLISAHSEWFANLWNRIVDIWKISSMQRKLGIAGVAALLCLGAIMFTAFQILSPSDERSEPISSMPSNAEAIQQSPPKEEGNQGMIATIPTDGRVVSIATLGSSFFFATKTSLFQIKENEKAPISLKIPNGPDISHIIAMEDVRALFIVRTDHSLTIYTPANNRFRQESVRFPDGADISRMTTATTYLYAIDAAHGNVQRFPRIEGGFGPGTSWLKESRELSADTPIAVDASLYLASSGRIESYFRGITENVSFQPPSNSPAVLADIAFAHSGSPLFALESASGEILLYDATDGSIINRYSDESLRSARRIAVHDRGDAWIVCVSKENSLIIFSLKKR